MLIVMDTANPRDRLVPFSSKLAFGVGQAAEGMKNTAFSLLILFYYNQVLGLPGTLAGLALFIALLFDAVTDPLAGSLSDNWKSRLGRRHPFMYASAVPLALAFVGLFSPPTGLGEWGLFGWLTIFAILTRGAMTLYHVPHLAIGAELTENFHERTRVVAFRQFFSPAGSAAAIVAIGYFFADARGGQLGADNYTPYALTLGVLMVTTIWYSAWGTQKEVPFLSDPAPRPKRNPVVQVVLDLREGFANRSFTWLFTGVLVVFIMAGVNGALDLYMLQYFWELEDTARQYVLLAPIAGLLIGVFLTAPLLRYTDKRFGLLLGTSAWAICQVIPVFLRLWWDGFPANGTAALIYTLLGFKFVQGIILQQAFIAFGSMMADVADEHEYTSGRRQEGIFFGSIAFSSKATSGFGNFIGGIGLDIISWPRGADIKTAADVPAETLVDLGILYGPVVAGFSIVSLWCYTHYNLDRKRHAEILRRLHQRRQSAAPSPPADAALG